MNVTAWILGVALATGFGIAGLTKVLDVDRLRDHLGYSKRHFQLIGLSEVSGAAAVIVGLVWTKFEWIALAAGFGFCTLMLGALMAHARANDDGKKVVPALAMLTLSIAFMIVVSIR